MSNNPVIVVVSAEWCGHCQEVKKGGDGSIYSQIIRVAKKYGDALIVNYPMNARSQPDLDYIPYTFYSQVKAFPSIHVFKRSLWDELWHDSTAIGSPVRSGFLPDVLESFLKSMGFSPVTNGRIVSPPTIEKNKDELIAAISGGGPVPVMSAEKAAAERLKNSDITHVTVGGQRIPLKEYLLARGSSGK